MREHRENKGGTIFGNDNHKDTTSLKLYTKAGWIHTFHIAFDLLACFLSMAFGKKLISGKACGSYFLAQLLS